MRVSKSLAFCEFSSPAVIPFCKCAFLEFCSMHDTLQSIKFTTLQCQLVKNSILDTKLSDKSNFETHEGVPTKARVSSKM